MQVFGHAMITSFNKILQVAWLALALPISAVISPAYAAWHLHEFDVMGTRASVEIWRDSVESPSGIYALVEAEMRRIEALMSPYIDTSELSAINRLGANEELEISEEMYRLLTTALYFGSITDGAFDISFASAGHLYDYRAAERPTEAALAKSLLSVGYQHIELKNNMVKLAERQSPYTIRFLKPNMRIDLGGIAKGYAVDQSIELLRSHGVEAGLVSAGGDSRMMGNRGINKANGEVLPWVIGIIHPRDKDKQAFRLPLSDTALSTSGDYERYFIEGEQRFHHIIHPSTGASVSGVVSATVIGPESVRCDALSTSVFVLGVGRGLQLINQLENYDAILIDSAGKVHYSAGLLGE